MTQPSLSERSLLRLWRQSLRQRYIQNLRAFGFAALVLLGWVVAGFVEPAVLVTGVVAVVDGWDEFALVDPISVNPPASVSTHITENSGCDPHEIPATW